MAVTKYTETVTAPWTNNDLRTGLENIFVNSGVMPGGWYDSWDDTYGHAIMEKQWSGTATFGKIYYGFKFNGSTFEFCVLTHSWDAVNHTWGPNELGGTATQRLDYPDGYSFTVAESFGDVESRVFDTNISTSNLEESDRISLNTSQDVVFTAWRSAVDPDFVVFGLNNGTSWTTWFFHGPPASWIDLNRNAFGGIVWPLTRYSSYETYVNFMMLGGGWLKHYPGGQMAGTDTNPLERESDHQVHSCFEYRTLGNSSAVTSNLLTSDNSVNRGCIIQQRNTSVWGTETWEPILAGPVYSFYAADSLPSDFGIFQQRGGSLAPTFRDTLVATSGAEEYEVLYPGRVSSSTAYTNLHFVARTV